MRRFPLFLQWVITLILSISTGLLFQYFHLPAAMLLGPMLIGIIVSLAGANLYIPTKGFIAALSILGCIIAQGLSADIFIPVKQHWLIISVVLLLTMLASTICGWFLICYSRLPGTTGAWGTAPGGASAMIAMSADYGADMRLVAFTQYLRVLLVIITAVMVTHYLSDGITTEKVVEPEWFPPITKHLFYTIVLAFSGGWLGRRLSIPSGAMLIPMFLATLLRSQSLITLELPLWLNMIAYMTIGLSIGLRFNMHVLRLAFRSLPQILASILLLMLICALSALMLTKTIGTDYLTAYLATSPGGLDTVAIIAAGTGSDMSLIISIQTLRLLIVLFTGPMIARYLARWAKEEN